MNLNEVPGSQEVIEDLTPRLSSPRGRERFLRNVTEKGIMVTSMIAAGSLIGIGLHSAFRHIGFPDYLHDYYSYIVGYISGLGSATLGKAIGSSVIRRLRTRF